MKKKPTIKYTDMCIYVDANIGKQDADVEKIYEYLTMISYMLAVKKKLFSLEDYYDKYAHYIASSVYMRMTSKKPGLEPVKSCLNYIKSIITKRKSTFEALEYGYTTEPDTIENEAFKNFNENKARFSLNPFASIEANEYFSSISNIIYDIILQGPYKDDKVLVWKLYQSCVISLLRNFTLSNKHKLKLLKKGNEDELRDDYENLLPDFMEDETRTAPIVYNLDNEWIDYISVLLQQIKTTIASDINEICDMYVLSDKMVEDVLLVSSLGENDG